MIHANQALGLFPVTGMTGAGAINRSYSILVNASPAYVRTGFPLTSVLCSCHLALMPFILACSCTRDTALIKRFNASALFLCCDR